MRFSASEILSTAGASGFNATVVEKALHLVHLLNVLSSHPSLRGKWVLKGGTAFRGVRRDEPQGLDDRIGR